MATKRKSEPPGDIPSELLIRWTKQLQQINETLNERALQPAAANSKLEPESVLLSPALVEDIVALVRTHLPELDETRARQTVDALVVRINGARISHFQSNYTRLTVELNYVKRLLREALANQIRLVVDGGEAQTCNRTKKPRSESAAQESAEREDYAAAAAATSTPDDWTDANRELQQMYRLGWPNRTDYAALARAHVWDALHTDAIYRGMTVLFDALQRRYPHYAPLVDLLNYVEKFKSSEDDFPFTVRTFLANMGAFERKIPVQPTPGLDGPNAIAVLVDTQLKTTPLYRTPSEVERRSRTVLEQIISQQMLVDRAGSDPEEPSPAAAMLVSRIDNLLEDDDVEWINLPSSSSGPVDNKESFV